MTATIISPRIGSVSGSTATPEAPTEDPAVRPDTDTPDSPAPAVPETEPDAEPYRFIEPEETPQCDPPATPDDPNREYFTCSLPNLDSLRQ